MSELSLHDIEQIARDVRREEICYSHLAEELTDHLCCDVEEIMRTGLNFHEAYHTVKEKMGDRRLKKIQEETLYAVDTKYRKMKNTMKISGVTGTIMLGIAALFKVMHWPGAGIILTLGALTLAFVFMPSALTVLWKESHSKNRLFLYISAFITAMMFIAGVTSKVQHWPFSGGMLTIASLTGIFAFMPSLLSDLLRNQENRQKRIVYILGSVGLIFYILGVLFKIQHWPHATLLLTLGVLIGFLVVFPWYTFISWKEDNNVSAKFIFILVGSLALVLPGTLLNLNLQNNFNAGYYRQQSEQQALFDYLFNDNHSFVSNCNDTVVLPLLEEIDTRTINLLQLIDKTEVKLIAVAEGKPGEPAILTSQVKETDAGTVIQFEALNYPFHPVPFHDFLQEDSEMRTELLTALNEYSGYMATIVPESNLKDYGKLLDLSVYLPESDPKTERVSLITGLHMLELLKTGILTTESHVLSVVYKPDNK